MMYTKKQLREAAGRGDETGPPEITRTKRAIGSKTKRQAKRKAGR